MKTIKSPIALGRSLVMVIPDAIVQFYGITKKSRLTIETNKQGFRVKVRK